MLLAVVTLLVGIASPVSAVYLFHRRVRLNDFAHLERRMDKMLAVQAEHGERLARIEGRLEHL